MGPCEECGNRDVGSWWLLGKEERGRVIEEWKQVRRRIYVLLDAEISEIVII